MASRLAGALDRRDNYSMKHTAQEPVPTDAELAARWREIGRVTQARLVEELERSLGINPPAA